MQKSSTTIVDHQCSRTRNCAACPARWACEHSSSPLPHISCPVGHVTIDQHHHPLFLEPTPQPSAFSLLASSDSRLFSSCLERTMPWVQISSRDTLTPVVRAGRQRFSLDTPLPLFLLHFHSKCEITFRWQHFRDKTSNLCESAHALLQVFVYICRFIFICAYEPHRVQVHFTALYLLHVYECIYVRFKHQRHTLAHERERQNDSQTDRQSTIAWRMTWAILIAPPS